MLTTLLLNDSVDKGGPGSGPHPSGIILHWHCKNCGNTGKTYLSGEDKPGDTDESIAREFSEAIQQSHSKNCPTCKGTVRHLTIQRIEDAHN